MKRNPRLPLLLLTFTALALLLVAGCKKDPVYTKALVKSFKLMQVPLTKPGGGSWEDIPLVEGGPDVYWTLTDANDSVYHGSRDLRFDNVTQQNFPLVRVLTTPLTLTPLSAAWNIKIYDYDLLGGDDLMTTLGPFRLDAYTKEKTPPTTLTLTTDSTTMILEVEWME